MCWRAALRRLEADRVISCHTGHYTQGMAGVASREVRIEIDKAAYEKLGDFGEVAIKGKGEIDSFRIVFRDEDLEKGLEKPD